MIKKFGEKLNQQITHFLKLLIIWLFKYIFSHSLYETMDFQQNFSIITIHIHFQILDMKFGKMLKDIHNIDQFDVFVYVVIWREARDHEFADVVRQVF